MYFSGSDNIVSTYAYKFTITFTYTSSGGFTWTGCTLVPNTYTVSEYRVLGSTVASTAFATATATQGTAFAVPSQPADTPTGYTWDGWYTDSACTSAYTSRLWTADGNLYAHYTALVVYEAVVFDAYKGSADAATYYGYGSTYSTLLLASESATSGIAFTPTSTPASRTDYTFSGNWYTDPQCTTAFTSGTLSANTYLFAKYTLTDTSADAIYLMSFVDRMHKAGLGVILDFAPVHFATDSYSLREFDGTCLYEYADPRHTISPWGSAQFDLGKDPVRSFLMSAMNYFLTYFHFDGIRVDAVSNIVYWDGNKANGENTGSTEFIKRLNGKLHLAHPEIMMNGALTIGTLDGANIEIADYAGHENEIIFGLKADEVQKLSDSGTYSPWDIYNKDPRVKNVMDSLFSGPWCQGDENRFRMKALFKSPNDKALN